jgi:hypothetical protein
MKGFVLAWDVTDGVGAIVADDGRAFAFARDDILEGDEPRAGGRARFDVDGDRAVAVRLEIAPIVVESKETRVVVRDVQLPWARVFWITFQFAVAAAVIAVAVQILTFSLSSILR